MNTRPSLGFDDDEEVIVPTPPKADLVDLSGFQPKPVVRPDTQKVAEAAYRFGERGFLDVLDAQRVYRAARAELISARYELAAAWVEIERLRAIPGETK